MVIRLGLKPEGRGQSSGGGQVARLVEAGVAEGRRQPAARTSGGQRAGAVAVAADCSQHSKGEDSLIQEREFVSRDV